MDDTEHLMKEGTGMIEIAKLKNGKGVLKYGTCSGCSKNSKDDPEMIRITLKQYSSGISVCLCKECSKELLKILQSCEEEST